MTELTADEKSKILARSRTDWTRAMENERENIQAAYDDLDFLAGNQWPQQIKAQREAEDRPCLTNNQMPQFVHQVTGDIRKMRPAIKVVGVDDQADPKLADLREGLIRYIENRSDASGVYFSAADNQVACGTGHWRVITEYADDTTFEQEIRIDTIDDQVAVLWDPDAKHIEKDDAKFCFVPVDYTQEYFKERWPDATMASMDDVKAWNYYTDWVTPDKIRVAEYWVKKPKKLVLALMPDGRTIDCTEDEDGVTAAQKAEVCTGLGGRLEKRDSYSICRYLVTAMDVLEYQEWVGRYIPIVPVLGEEIRIGKKRIRRGLIREAKDAQRQFNYFCSAHTEVVALQPKAPFMVTEVNVAKYQGMWEQANAKNFPYLLYTPDPKNGDAAPQRVQPAVSSQGITEGLTLANENMRRITGIYDASLGAKSNETSGIAIQQREQQGDTGTVVYRDNFGRAIRHTGRILIDLIPHIYDSARTIRIMGEDGKVDLMQINQDRDPRTGLPILDGMGKEITLNDISVGAYDVIAEVGNSYATKREESAANMVEFTRAMPNVAALVADLIAKAQDWPMADKFAERLHAALPPQILAAEKAKEQEESGQPPQVDPQQQIAQAAQMEQLKAGLVKVRAEASEAESKAKKADADAVTAMANAEKAIAEAQMAKQSVGAGAIDILKDADRHIAELQQARERHVAGLAMDADNHMASLARQGLDADHAQEKHETTIAKMNEPAAPAGAE